MIIPTSLGKEPLLEAICEFRFSSKTKSVVDLLPGILYQEFRGKYKNIYTLPAKNLPLQVLEENSSLRYTPTIRLEGEPYSIQIGEHVISLSCRKPYTGWGKFKLEIESLVAKLGETGLITNPERYSLKYIDIIPEEVRTSLDSLNVEVRLGGHNVTKESFRLRTEKEEEGYIHIIQVGLPATAELPNGAKFQGISLEIDTIRKPASDFWNDFSASIDKAHELNKNLFFSLLSDETMKTLEPKW
ncbi:MAG: TIGR04255 family protein [Nitrospinae bacterium]|nr:TIGR04255 family protein [Nitrospinota bacterium]